MRTASDSDASANFQVYGWVKSLAADGKPFLRFQHKKRDSWRLPSHYKNRGGPVRTLTVQNPQLPIALTNLDLNRSITAGQVKIVKMFETPELLLHFSLEWHTILSILSSPASGEEPFPTDKWRLVIEQARKPFSFPIKEAS